MLRTIRRFFDSRINPGRGAEADIGQRLQVATAALLIEMMRMDSHIKKVEQQAVVRAIRAKFGLTPEETAALMHLAQEEARCATDYYQFTSLINRGFTPEQKERIVEHMWQVAYADGRIDKYEEHLVRKIADLLYVPHRAYIAAKLRACEAARLGK